MRKSNSKNMSGMEEFTLLIRELEQAITDESRVQSLTSYLELVDDNEKLWAISLFNHYHFSRCIDLDDLKVWASEWINLPEWLYEESLKVIKDPLETISLMLPKARSPKEYSLAELIQVVLSLDSKNRKEKEIIVKRIWKLLKLDQRILFNRMITGRFRLDLTYSVLANAIANHTGTDQYYIADKLRKKWSPADISFQELFLEGYHLDQLVNPHSFRQTQALTLPVSELGSPKEWSAEYKIQGVRIQLVNRSGRQYLWSEEGDLLNDVLPELQLIQSSFNEDVVMDGEVFPVKNGVPLPLHELMSRLKKKRVSKASARSVSITFLATDILESGGVDLREKPLLARRKQLRTIISEVNHSVLKFSEEIVFDDWTSLEKIQQTAGEKRFMGLILKRKKGQYAALHEQPDWLFWPVTKQSILAVLTYINTDQRKQKDASAEYTFSVWNGNVLIPFVKAYQGLSQDEVLEIDEFVKSNIIKRFGPVKSVEPQLVFEISFDGIAASNRHKSGVILGSPVIEQWKTELSPDQAATIEDLFNMIK